MKKIDIHCHTTTRELPNLIEKSATLEVIEKRMSEFDIEKTVVLASYFPHTSSGISNYRMANWIEWKDNFEMFGSLDFEHYFKQGFNELEELGEARIIKGIKIYSCYQKIDMEGDKINRVGKLANKLGIPLMFHSGYSHKHKDYGKDIAISNLVTPIHIEKVARNNEGLKIIISHMAKPFFAELNEVVKRNELIFTDMGGLIESGAKSDILEIPDAIIGISQFLQECGPEKLLFATDFPVQTHADSINFIEAAMQGFSNADKQLVYYDNSAKLLELN